MPKSVSLRDSTLLTLPVLLLGGLGLYLTARPRLVDDGKPHFTFRVDKPTTLEAFLGYDGAFVLEASQHGKAVSLNGVEPYLEMKSKYGTEKSVYGYSDSLLGAKVWGGNVNNSRFTFKLRSLPPGTLHFGARALIGGVLTSNWNPLPNPAAISISGRWKVDRAAIHPPKLAALPRDPWISILSVTISNKNTGKATGEIVFGLQGFGMDESTPLEINFGCRNGTMGWGSSPFPEGTSPRIRTVTFTPYPNVTSKLAYVSGRVSAGKNWPLGFEIEPFDYKKVKVGHRLKVKSFPVVLPKT